jgi:hypothetical protein
MSKELDYYLQHVGDKEIIKPVLVTITILILQVSKK